VIEILPILGIAEVKPGDDLAVLINTALARNGLCLARPDILVVTQKIVSKAEGRFANLEDVVPGAEAKRLARIVRKDARLVELVLSESVNVVRAVPNVLITRHKLGFVMANAGIDRSNLGPDTRDQVLLLPTDPDASARVISDQCGGVGVVISDSFGRPWRYGVVGVAIGCAGLPALIDRRGALDRDGRRLEVTQIALADMIATAASLVTGEGAESIPAVIVRGYRLPDDAAISPARALVRPREEDLFP
jgi:coenzyme F420-0:L-glutamate ligase / coenzyme F420-1:gamma-L-glutamate ligase